MLKKLQHFLVLLLGLAMGLTACTGESNVGQEDLQPVVVSGPISRVESFSPDGSMFVSVEERVMAGPVKRIMDLEGNTYELPCSPISYDEANFGPVFWQGTRLVYSVTGWGPGAAIYVYDWKEQTSVNIAEGFNWDSSEPPSVRPVFSGENAVTMLQPDGIWSYDLQQQRWEHRRLQLPARRGLETWSPDLGKVAWVEYGQEADSEGNSTTVIVEENTTELTNGVALGISAEYGEGPWSFLGTAAKLPEGLMLSVRVKYHVGIGTAHAGYMYNGHTGHGIMVGLGLAY